MKLALCFLLSLTAMAGVNVTARISGSVAEVARIQKILPVVEKVLNSAEFKDRVLKAKFTETKDSSLKVYETINSWHWENEYEFKVNRNRRVVGWTYPSVKTVWINSRGFSSRSDSGIAGTICHEATHKMGYTHKSAKSHQSVPYSIGTICSQLYEKEK
jgi:hypothetical protein